MSTKSITPVIGVSPLSITLKILRRQSCYLIIISLCVALLPFASLSVPT